MSRGFLRLLAAQSISSLGDWLATFALMALALDLSGSATAVGGVLVLRLAPAGLAGPVVGWVGARFGRRHLLPALDLVRAAAVAAIPLVDALWWLYGWMLLMETATVVAAAARDASIRDLVPVDTIHLANGAMMGASYGAIPLGAAAFTILGVTVPRAAEVALWVDAGTFLVSSVLVSGIGELPSRPDLSPSRETVGGALRIPLVRRALPPLVAASVGIGTLFSLGIGYAEDVLGADEAQFGLLVVGFGVGAVAGLGLVRRLGARLATVRVGVATMGSVLVVMGLVPRLDVAFLAAALFGAAGASSVLSGLTRVQTDLEAGDRLVALGAFHVGVRLALAVGALAAGVAHDLTSGLVQQPARAVLVGAGLVVLLSAGAMAVPVSEAAEG